MVETGRFLPTAEKIAERFVTEDMAKSVARLPEQFLPVGQK
jgi:hypothetical protein